MPSCFIITESSVRQEEFNRRLKAKRAIFSNKRSLSLASFKIPMPSAISAVRPPLLLKKKQSFSGSGTGLPTTLADLAPKKVDVDVAYIKATQPKGELDLLNLESLINLDDVNKGGRGGGGKGNNANSLSISGII